MSHQQTDAWGAPGGDVRYDQHLGDGQTGVDVLSQPVLVTGGAG